MSTWRKKLYLLVLEVFGGVWWLRDGLTNQFSICGNFIVFYSLCGTFR